MILIVEPDARRMATYEHELEDVEGLAFASTLDSARAMIHGAQWSGMAVNATASARDGLKLAAELRRRAPAASLLVASIDGDRDARVHAGQLLAILCTEPLSPNLLRSFVRHTRARVAQGLSERLATLLDHWQARYTLTRAEKDILRLRADGMARHEIAARLGHRASTLDRHVKNILKKTYDASLDEAVGRVLRDTIRAGY
jgi:DNA-binding NarL/FixJ family response regulator